MHRLLWMLSPARAAFSADGQLTLMISSCVGQASPGLGSKSDILTVIGRCCKSSCLRIRAHSLNDEASSALRARGPSSGRRKRLYLRFAVGAPHRGRTQASINFCKSSREASLNNPHKAKEFFVQPVLQNTRNPWSLFETCETGCPWRGVTPH